MTPDFKIRIRGQRDDGRGDEYAGVPGTGLWCRFFGASEAGGDERVAGCRPAGRRGQDPAAGGVSSAQLTEHKYTQKLRVSPKPGTVQRTEKIALSPLKTPLRKSF